jgi:hypothetical protein
VRIVTRDHVSKHRQFDKYGKWIEGKVRIGPHSGLRKLMRAARRGKIPDDRMFLIQEAMKSAAAR